MRSSPKRQPLQWFLSGLLLLTAVGCSRPIAEPVMPVEPPQTFSTQGTEPMPEKWWRTFDDDELDALIERALAENFSLQTAWDRLAQAEAVAKRSGAALKPQADITALYSRTRREVQDQTSYSSLYGLGIGASYEVDLWSRVRSGQQAALLEAQAGRDAVDTAAITLSAGVANTWYQLAGAKVQVRIAREQIETNQQVLDIVTVQYRNGKASAADVLRQRQLVASTEAQLITAQEAVELLQYTLSVLIGMPPEQAWRDTDLELPELTPMPELGMPTEILWRRPDVRRAYRQVQAADQRLAVAVAERYPRLSLSGSVESSVPSVSDLFDDWLANFTANAFQPLFDAGLRKAEVERQEAIVSERLHTWGQTLLAALQEVETALTQQRQQELLWENLEHQLTLARETNRRNRERFMKGQVDYIRVLESLSSLQVLERSVITARRLRIQFRIDLYRSIAGPWEMTRPALARISEPSESTAPSETTVYEKKAPL